MHSHSACAGIGPAGTGRAERAATGGQDPVAPTPATFSAGFRGADARWRPKALAVVLLAHALILAGMAASRPEPRPETEKTLLASLILAEAATAEATQAQDAAPMAKAALPQPSPATRTPPVETPRPSVETSPPAPPDTTLQASAVPRPLPATEPLPVRPAPAPALPAKPEPRPEPVVVKSEPVPSAVPAPVPAPVTAPAPALPAAPAPRPDAETPPAARAMPAALPGKPDDVKRYIAALMRQLNRHKTYPAELKKTKTEGRVVLQFSLDRSGRLTAASVKQSSGHPELDRAALEMLARANPLPAIPDFMARDELALAIPVEYSLITDR